MISFLVRFVQDEPGDEPGEAAEQPLPAGPWHGTIRHVQSDAERRFTHWEDAVAFIAQFVDIGQGTR